VRDEPAIPGEHGVRPGHASDLLQRLPAESLTDLGQRGPLSIVQSQDLFTMRFQDPILRREVLVLQLQFLIDQTGRIGQQTYPLIISHPEISS
jgi:hypothetical protein